ncbi:MAG: TraB/GumN family protein, partial [Bacteroidota bacterium]
FGEAAKIVLELDMDDPSLQMEMMQYAMMPDGKTLKDYLNEEEYAKLDAWIQGSAGVKLEMVHGMQPLLLTSLIMKEYLGEDPASYELSLVQMAKEQQKDIMGLESVKEQMSAITDYGIDNQVRDLKDMIAQPDTYREAFNQLVDAYKANDPDGLYQFIQSQMPGNSMNTNLITTRNQKWIPRIQKMAADESCFFAVGSGHLGGELGVIRLLREAGYTVSAVQ